MKMLSLLLTACLVAAACAHGNLSPSDIQGIVNLSNQIRQQADSSMPKLHWDATLAQFAAQRADLCNFQHTPNNQYGENLFWTSVANLPLLDAVREALNDWHREIKYVDSKWGCIRTQDYRKTCGHYSQEVWAKTTSIGCGLNTHCTGSYAGTYVVCEYSPAGNVGEWKYENGEWVIYQPPPY